MDGESQPSPRRRSSRCVLRGKFARRVRAYLHVGRSVPLGSSMHAADAELRDARASGWGKITLERARSPGLMCVATAVLVLGPATMWSKVSKGSACRLMPFESAAGCVDTS
jgi:hypothetical protein